jgi:hypothetical protein
MQHTAPQKETPTTGSNQAAGESQNDSVIISGIPQSINPTANERVRELASASRARLLAKAANFASLHAPHTLWQRRMKVGAVTLLIRLEWPGVLSVFDPATGEALARSAPGQPDTLLNK